MKPQLKPSSHATMRSPSLGLPSRNKVTPPDPRQGYPSLFASKSHHTTHHPCCQQANQRLTLATPACGAPRSQSTQDRRR